MSQELKQKVIAYVDGFNLYFGLRECRLQRYYWLNVRELAISLLKPNQELIFTKYFTARISGPKLGDSSNKATYLETKRIRQSRFLEALGSLPDFQIYEGHFLGKPTACHECGASWLTHEEKMTDVNIATEMIFDAFNNNFDTALLISGDSDLVPPILAIRERFPEKRIVVGFPPRRASEQLRRVANACFTLGREKFRHSQFPDRITKPDGFVLNRPKNWR